jgi:thiosulfate dehydrogenase [quinone] large subunit
MAEKVTITEPAVSEFFFANTKAAWGWLIVRVYVGWQWLTSGWGKIGEPGWTGENAGSAVSGFVRGALEKASGPHPDVQSWYAWFLEEIVLPNADVFGYLVAYGEFLVGIALVIGLFVGIAAFFGMFMNMSFLLAGTVSSNPILLILSIGLILAWRIAGWVGLDRWVLPALGTPWQTTVRVDNST